MVFSAHACFHTSILMLLFTAYPSQRSSSQSREAPEGPEGYGMLCYSTLVYIQHSVPGSDKSRQQISHRVHILPKYTGAVNVLGPSAVPFSFQIRLRHWRKPHDWQIKSRGWGRGNGVSSAVGEHRELPRRRETDEQRERRRAWGREGENIMGLI